jgi:hypothetical protein
MVLPRPVRALGFLWMAAALPLAAQLAPISVPKGLLRLDFAGRFENWDQRFLNGVKQDPGADFTHNPFSAGFLPTLATAEAELRRVTGVQAISLSLGSSSSAMLVNVGTGSIGAAYGLTSRLTLFGTVPIVRVRIQNRFSLDSTEANAGFNPADPSFGNAAGAALTSSFLAQFQSTLTTISTRLTAGTYDANPAQKVLAQQIVALGTPLHSDLKTLLETVTFLPVAGSEAAGSLLAPIESLQASVETLDPAFSFTALPALPTRGPGGQEFEDFITSPDGPFQARAFSPPILQYIGDIEVGAAFTWLDRRPRNGGIGIRSVLVGTVRLRTGQLDRPNDFFDIGTGDRQPDVQGDLVTDLVRGRVGARLTARYVLQLPGRKDRRLSPPDQPLAPAATVAAVEWDPGEIVEGSFEPFLRIGPTLALSAGVRHRSKRADHYSYVRNQAPIEGTTPDVLAIGSAQNATSVSAGLTWAHDGRRRDGTVGMPMDASLRWEKVTRSSLGRVPASESVSMALRFYRRIF